MDYLTYEPKNNIWKCYEIKVSKSDFYSNAKKTFVGNYNYFVLTDSLYEQVKNDIPDHVGVYTDTYPYVKKKAKKQELKISKEILMNSMIRSLYREYDKAILSNSKSIISDLQRELLKTRGELNRCKKEKRKLILEKLGNKITEK